MKRRWNHLILAGFALVVVGLVSYVPFFSLFPVTRDFPWANLLFFAAGAPLLGKGLGRAFGQPQLYRGRVFGPILTAISAAAIAFFCFGLFYAVRQLPASQGAPSVGQKAPDFSLPDQNGKAVTLAELLATGPSGGSSGGKGAGAVLIFYRGYW
jgi:hypothetical protein